MVSRFGLIALTALAATCVAVAAFADPSLPQAERVMLRSTERLPAVDHVVVFLFVWCLLLLHGVARQIRLSFT